ncbi:9436_t:CDS:1 [Funneliformis geosporum]|uniref:13885_t:CDS:1 n=1 Tax=Funneliformis geosporum TaxID=1117311 RepID=A0A9W4WWU2_9GLOM|nr:13885_t:CDS:1 [Funneliformis geosporum]CAI2185227.1 9436_t:CDS:1 [Funneliformis geosporum]
MSERNTSTTNNNVFKQRESKEEQHLMRNNDTPLYTLEFIDLFEWKLFRWLASLEKVENFVYLFIVIWDSISLQNPQILQEFIKDTNDMVASIKELAGLKALGSTQRGVCISNLIEYKKSRFNDNHGLQKRFADNAWAELEDYKLRHSHAFEEQLKRLTMEQKMCLRQTIYHRMNSFRSFANRIQKSNKREEEFVNDLKEQIKTLKEENSQQQAALGNIINVSWDDDDSNNTGKLIADIEELQDMLSDFTMVQGSDFKVNIDAATSILKNYNCQGKYPSTDADLILGAVLQRCTIATILDEVQKHLQNARTDNIDPLESDIVNTTESLIKYTELLRDNRKGSDDISKVTPIKIRQYVYSALGCRGFFDNENPLIKRTANKLLNEMNQFRQVMEKETSDELNDLAFTITREVINIFCFRLKTQASELQHKFFQAGQAIDVRFMRGSFGRDEAKNLEVEICGFPCIGVFDGEQKVFTRAQVIARKKRRNSDESIVKTMKNLIIGNK